MDATRLHRLVETLVAADSRRGLLRLLAALPVLGSLALLLDEGGQASRRRRRRGRPHDENKKKKKRRKKKRRSSAGSSPPCVPRSCPADSCGPMPNGCGGMLACGGCPTNQICLMSNVCQPCSITCTGTPEDCGDDLQEALDAGGGFFVCPGLYRRQQGFVAGADPVTLTGAGQGDDETSNTVLESGGNTRVLTIPPGMPPLTLERLQLRNGRFIITGATHISGGGILLQQNSTLRMTECTVRRNDLINQGSFGTLARGGGMAVEPNSTLEMTRCTVRENTITGNSMSGQSGLGGGVWTAGTTNLTDCLVESNNAVTLGGGLSVEGGTTTLAGSTRVRLNRAESGAGIFVKDSELEIAATSRVTENRSPSGAGPGGINNTNGTVTLAGPDPSPIVVNNCPENCNTPAVPKCSTAPPVSCPP